MSMTVLARATSRLRDRTSSGGAAGRTATGFDQRLLVRIIAALQFGWLWWVYAHGWYLQADLSNMVDALGRRPDWGYLSQNLDGHFAPVDRLVYWVQDKLVRLDYGPAIALRLAFQLASTLLLFRVLAVLTRQRLMCVAIVAAYATNSMLAAGTAMFTPGIGITIGQTAALLACLAHLRYERTLRLRYEAAAGLLIALAMLCSEQWVIGVLILPLLSLLRGYPGRFRGRLRQLANRWRGWLVVAVAPAAVGALAAYYVAPVGARAVRPGEIYALLRDSWLKSLAPTLIGGPFRWYVTITNLFAVAAPTDVVVILGQLAFAAVVLLGIRRRGVISLTGWLLPLTCWVASTLLVGYRGYALYGVSIAVTPRYLSALIMVFALGAALALTGPPADEGAAVADTDSGADRPVKRNFHLPRLTTAAGAAAVVTVVILSAVSGARYANLLGHRDAQGWVTNLTDSARVHGPPLNVYDTAAPVWLISDLEPHHRVSDLLRLAGIRASYQSPASIPLVARHDGRLTASVFVPAGTVSPVGTCGSAIRGAETVDLALDHPVSKAEWWLHLALYQHAPSTVEIHLVSRTGVTSAPVGGARQHLTTLESVTLRLPQFAVAAVRVTSTDPHTALCLATVQVGAPFPVVAR